MSQTPRPSWFYALVGGLSYPVLRLVFRERWTGIDHLPETGGYVLAANHWSNFDPWPLGIPLFPRRYLRFMAKQELFWFPLGVFIKAGGGFPVRRGERDTAAVDVAVRLCLDGHVVVMFPEGTRRSKGMRKRYQPHWHSGAARIALEANVPLVPAAIAGTDRLAHLPQVRVAFGPAVRTGDLAALPLPDAAQAASERLRDEIARLEQTLT